MSFVPKKVDFASMNPLYKGSVQHLYNLATYPNLLVSEITSGGSVFDVGTVFYIEGNDVSRSCFRHYIYQQLADKNSWSQLADEMRSDGRWQFIENNPIVSQLFAELLEGGAATHHLGMIDSVTGEVHSIGFPETPSNMSLIAKHNVYKPAQMLWQNHHFYDYSILPDDDHVIPLEYIVRFGIARGSSILSRYNGMTTFQQSDLLEKLRLDRICIGQKFDFPITDCSSKYEPEDRALNIQEAALISRLSGEEFRRSLALSVLASCLVESSIKDSGLTLWDLKWEFARKDDKLIIIDTIDTDSVRLTMNVEYQNEIYTIDFSKQAMRDYYRIMHPRWCVAVSDAKKLAVKTGESFVKLLQVGQKSGKYPLNPEPDHSFIAIQEKKFKVIKDNICLQQDSLNNSALYKIGLQEVDYYLQSQASQAFREYNGL